MKPWPKKYFFSSNRYYLQIHTLILFKTSILSRIEKTKENPFLKWNLKICPIFSIFLIKSQFWPFFWSHIIFFAHVSNSLAHICSWNNIVFKIFNFFKATIIFSQFGHKKLERADTPAYPNFVNLIKTFGVYFKLVMHIWDT